MKYELDIFHYLAIYKREWRRMALLILIAVSITALYSFLQPAVYRSTAIVLSPKEGGQVGAVGGALGLLNVNLSSSFDQVIFSMLKSARMRKDIYGHFNLKDKPKFWWGLDTYVVEGGFAVEVKGPDPDMTEKIANFAIENLDKINSELQVTLQRPIAKVLDPATRGVPISKRISKRVIASGLFILLGYSLFIFFKGFWAQYKKLK